MVIPARTKTIPTQVSELIVRRPMKLRLKSRGECDVPFEMDFPSTNHSPKTVKRKAREFVMGTVKLKSADVIIQI
jgi:hypothetical protein